MPSSDAERWDARYDTSDAPTDLAPPEVVESWLSDLPTNARAFDVACGWGDAGLWLAQHGAEVTLADVSSIALDAALLRASELELAITTVVTDLTTDDLPQGPWEAIVCTHYLDRTLIPRLGETLSPTGRLVLAIATTTNLERHPRPSARFLLEPGELPTLVPGLDVIHHDETWRSNGVHEAWGVFGPAPK